MNVVVMSEHGRTAGLAGRLRREGHTVNFVCPKDGPFFERHNREMQGLAPDVVVVDSASLGRVADRMRKDGLKVIGASQWTATIAEDVGYMKSVLSSVGIPTDVVPDGVNLYVTGWFNGNRFVGMYVSLLYRRVMAGGRGPDVGRVGSISYHGALTSRTYKSILQPLENILRRVNHRGPIHAHVTISPTAYSITELNTNLDSPLSITYAEAITNTATDTLTRIINESSEPIPTKPFWTSTALLTTAFVEGGAELRGICAGALKHICPIQLTHDGGKYITAGPEVCYVTSRGNSLPETTRRMYRTLENISTPDCMYRNDIGRGVQGILDTLTKSGWLT